MIPLLVVAGLVGSVALWCGVVWLSSRGGWTRLARTYATRRVPEGERIVGSMRLARTASYSGCIAYHVGHEGLFVEPTWPFRVGHARLFFPWGAVTFTGERSQHRWKWCVMRVDGVDLQVPQAVGDGAAGRSRASGAPA